MFPVGFEMFNNLGAFNKSLKCFSVIMMGGKERHDVDKGGKIILPASALDHLTRLHIEFPMLFKLSNRSKNRSTHCGVLEFVAEEGRCYLPFWMMKNLYIQEGDILQVEYTNLPIAKFAKFQPQSVDFLEITNPKAVLENALRNFACLTKGDVVSINYNDKDYELCILETKPGDAVSIIECDMDVDFAAPVGYEEPKWKKEPSKSLAVNKANFLANQKATPQAHPGYRLDGKPAKNIDVPMTSKAASAADIASSFQAAASYNSSATSSFKEPPKRGLPYYDFKIGRLTFHRDFDNDQEMEPEPVPDNVFKGHKLKHIGVKS